MRRHAEVVVVGGGIVGVATLHALARAGCEALLLERFEPGHTRGSSHGASRIFRLAYPNASYTRLAVDALARWRDLEAECGERLIVHTGTLDLGDAVASIEGALGELGIPFERLSPGEVASRWRLAFEPHAQLVFQADGGYSLADRAHAAFVAGALAAGGEIRTGERVTRLDPRADGVAVVTTAGEVTAGAVVVAAGAWTPALLDPLGIGLPVRPTRETVAYYAHPGADELPALIEYPSALNPLPAGQAYYALPAPGHGLKAGVHHSGPEADPEETGEPDPDVLEAISGWVARRFPLADPVPLGAETCLYTSTADESFVVEAHERVVVASACSGHGFKFAPVHGSLAAGLALDAGRRGDS